MAYQRLLTMMKLLRIAALVALAAPASAFFRKIGGITQRIKSWGPEESGRPRRTRGYSDLEENCGQSLRAARR